MRFSLILLLFAFSMTATAIGAETVIVTGATSASGSTIVDVGSMVGPGGAVEAATGQGTMAQNRTQNQTHEQMQNGTGVGEQVREQNEGISEQVREIVRNRKNGTISVPQGFLVRVVARNRTMSIENESFMLNETLQAQLSIKGENRTVRFRAVTGGIEMTEGGVPVLTNDTIEISNGMVYADSLAVSVLPSGIPGKVKANISGLTLGVEDGDPLYRFTAKKQVRLLWLIQSEMEVQTVMHASTGKILEERRPWWSFLASDA